MALYGEIKMTYRDDGGISLDASHCTADGGAAEIKDALQALAQELGADWKEEQHLIRGGAGHHSHSAGHDHHQHTH
jgi:hypothetical protein